MLGGLSLRYRVLMIATAATALMGSFAHEPVKATDLGGDCCADLEDRIAELEATTVRKGNKKVSVTLYGQENHSILFWDDGAEKNTYIVDNNYESSRFGFKGSAKTGLGDWVAGYRLEVEPTGANSAKLNQFDDDNANDSAGPLNVRHSYMYLSSKKYGEGRMGLTATPIYNITKDTNVTELEDTMHSDNRMMQGFFLRSKGFDNAEGLSKLKWQNISSCYDSNNAFVCGTRRTALPIGHPLGRASASRPAISRTTNGARLCATRIRFLSGEEAPGLPRTIHGWSAPASATPRIPTSATKPAAAARPTDQTPFPRAEQFQELQARRPGLGRVCLHQA